MSAYFQNSRFFSVLLVDKVTDIRNEMGLQKSRFENVWSQIKLE